MLKVSKIVVIGNQSDKAAQLQPSKFEDITGFVVVWTIVKNLCMSCSGGFCPLLSPVPVDFIPDLSFNIAYWASHHQWDGWALRTRPRLS